MSRFILAWTLLAAASAAQEVSSPPTAKFQVRPLTVGDRTEIKIESNVELDIVTHSLQEPDHDIKRQLTYVRTMECLQTVEAAGEGAAPSLRVLVATAKLQRSGTNIAPITETSEIESKSYVVTRGDKGRAVKAENGEPAHGDAGGLGAWEDFAKLLPSGEPKAGATWTVDAAAISALVTIPDLPAPTGTFEAKMESLSEGKAVVFFTGTLKGKTAKGFDTELTIAEGRLVFDTAKGRPASLVITGSLKAKREISQKVSKQKELKQVDEVVGDVTITSRKLDVKAEFK